MRSIITSLDLGSSTIKLIVGEVSKGKLNILSCIETPSRGIKNGFIINTESATVALKETFDKASESLGFDITNVIVLVPSYNAVSYVTEASIMIEGECITHDDINNVLHRCVDDKLLLTHKLVSEVPMYFVIDDNNKVKSPINMSGDKLYVRNVCTFIPNKNLSEVKRCLKILDVEVLDVAINPVSDYMQYMNSSYANSSGVLINIGQNKTEISVFSKGILLKSNTLNIGSILLDQELSNYYKIVRSDSILLREKLVVYDKNMAKPIESMSFTNKENDYIKINQYDASDICINKLLELTNFMKKEINNLTKREISYIMVTGGVSEGLCFDTFVTEVFGNKAKVMRTSDIGARNNKFSSALGLIKSYDYKTKLYDLNVNSVPLDYVETSKENNKRKNSSGNVILNKLFGHFFDNEKER